MMGYLEPQRRQDTNVFKVFANQSDSLEIVPISTLLNHAFSLCLCPPMDNLLLRNSPDASVVKRESDE